jgi:hypothetical protein
LLFEFPSTTEFQHLVARFDGAFRIYRDGVVVGDSFGFGCSGGSNGVFDTLKIGSNRGDNKRFRGTLDDVRVWNRALSDSEVALIYANGAAGVCDE